MTSRDVQHRTRLQVPSEMQIPTRGLSVLNASTRQPFCTQTSANLLPVMAAGDTCSFDLRREKQAGGSWSPAVPRNRPDTAVRGCWGGREELAVTAKSWENMSMGISHTVGTHCGVKLVH